MIVRFKTNKEFIGVVVPVDAKETEIISLDSKYLRYYSDIPDYGFINTKLNIGTLSNLQIIGTITKDKKFDFDCKDLVELGSYMNTYKNYIRDDTHKSNQLETTEDSFLSAIEATEELYFKNPIEKPDYNNFNLKYREEGKRFTDEVYKMLKEDNEGKTPTWQSIFNSNYENKLLEWQSYEDKTLKDNQKLVILEIL